MEKSHESDIEKSLKLFHATIGKNVARARKSKGVTQLELANMLGYNSVAAIAQPEIFYREKHFFSIGQIFKISQALKIDIHSIVPSAISTE